MSQILGYRLPEYLAARQSARRRESTIQINAAVAAVVCVVAAGLLIGPVNEIRKERQFVIDPDSISGLPPDLALLGKLGTFRALAIDWAAIRAERLKEEGKTYEALQLHLAICALAPRFPNVWVYAAWNMAYNISVSQYTPEARWQWVRNGIEILRDRGIRYNPKSVTLYKELAWIYWHKIGDFLDDEHLNYKRALAVDMERVLGPPPVVLTDEEYFDWFRPIAEAPELNELLADDPQVARLAAELRALELPPDETLLEFVARHDRPELRVADLLADARNVDEPTKKRLELIRDPEKQEVLARLLAAVRARVLRENLKLDPEWMMTLMEDRYGPLDWRNAFSHSLYWSSLGDEVSRGHANINIHDLLNNARFVFFSLQQLIMRGRLTLWPDFEDPFSSYIELTPDTRYIPYLYDEYLRLGKEHFGDDPRFVEGTPGPVYMTGFITSLRNWIQLLYLEGGERNRQMAEQFFAWLRENNPHPDGSTQQQYLTTLDTFVMDNIISQLQTYRAARAFIGNLIRRGLKYLSLGLEEAGVRALLRARKSYDYWMLDTETDINERRKMQYFPLIVRDEVEMYMTHPRVAPLYKAALWKNLPLEQRQMAFDRLLPYFQRLCEVQDPPWSLAVAFPEPPGMDEFRQREIPMRGEPRREDVEPGRRYRR